jgi:hypothetical protein
MGNQMKLRNLLRFSLELFLPESALLAFDRLAERPPPELPTPTDPAAASKSQCLLLIEELDSAQFGGPSFGQESIFVMGKALEDALALLPSPIENSRMRELAQKILDRAADGERNPTRLQQAALAELVTSESGQDH